MADPVKKAAEPAAEAPVAEVKAPAPAEKPIPSTIAETEVAALSQAQAANFTRARKGGGSQFVGPMGIRYDASPYVKARYNPRNARLGATPILGAPESIVSDDFKREHPGWKYIWPVTTNLQTQAYIRSGVYVPVPFDGGIDKSNPLAAVAPSVNGDTTWMQHTLCAIPPRWWRELYESAEIESVQRASINRQQVEAEINEQFARGGFKAEAEIQSDVRPENIL